MQTKVSSQSSMTFPSKSGSGLGALFFRADFISKGAQVKIGHYNFFTNLAEWHSMNFRLVKQVAAVVVLLNGNALREAFAIDP